MSNSVPQIIKKVGFDFWWDEKKVWKLDILATSMNIEELTWHLDYPFWDENNGRYNLKPIDVIKFPEQHQIEYQRILESDLSHPIDIMENKHRWLILDGLHRLTKAVINSQKSISVRIIPRERIPEILHDRAIAEKDPGSMR